MHFIRGPTNHQQHVIGIHITFLNPNFSASKSEPNDRPCFTGHLGESFLT